MTTLRTPRQCGELLQQRWPKQRAQWLRQTLCGEPFEMEMTLHVSRREAAGDIVAYNRWEAQWRDCVAGCDGLSLRMKNVDWKELGRDRTPTHVCVHSVQAAFVLMPQGSSCSTLFDRAAARVCALRDSGQEALSQVMLEEGKTLFEAEDAEFSRLVAVVLWLRDHCPADCYIRQIPVEGVDTKWLESNRGLTARFVAALTGQEFAANELMRRWNLKVPSMLIRLRHAQTFVKGLEAEDFVALPASVIARQSVLRLCVVENLQTGLCIQVKDDIPIVCGMGMAVRALSEVPAFRNAEIFYAGDLDQHGLHILAQLRSVCGNVRSVLMDIETLERYAALAVSDSTAPLDPPAEGLTEAELMLYERLHARRLRLEQERIPMDEVNAAFARALA